MWSLVFHHLCCFSPLSSITRCASGSLLVLRGRRRAAFSGTVCRDAQAQRGCDVTLASAVPSLYVLLKWCCVVPALLPISEGRLTALTLKGVSIYPTWNARESSCGADSQKLRGGRRKGTQKGVWHTERKGGKKLIRDYNFTKKEAAVPEEGCSGGVLHTCIPPLLLIFFLLLQFWKSQSSLVFSYWHPPLPLLLNWIYRLV